MNLNLEHESFTCTKKKSFQLPRDVVDRCLSTLRQAEFLEFFFHNLFNICGIIFPYNTCLIEFQICVHCMSSKLLRVDDQV